jgi:hypothetical protein
MKSVLDRNVSLEADATEEDAPIALAGAASPNSEGELYPPEP